MRELAEALPRCGALRRLVLLRVQLTEGQARELVEGLRGCEQLEVLETQKMAEGVGEEVRKLRAGRRAVAVLCVD